MSRTDPPGSRADISGGDYLSWYCSEITRYRDTEWAVSGYAGAFSLAVIYLATDPDRKNLIADYARLIVPAIVAFTSFFVWSEAHIHRALNSWRLRRDQLMRGGDHLKVAGNLIAVRDGRIDMKDLIYFSAFEGFVCFMALVAISVVADRFVAISGVVIGLVLTWACTRGNFEATISKTSEEEARSNADQQS